MAKTYQMNAFARFGNTMSELMIRLIVGPYFDVTPSSPDEAFVTEAARHPVFRVIEAS